MRDWEDIVGDVARRRMELGAEDFSAWALMLLGVLGRQAPDVLAFVMAQTDRMLDKDDGYGPREGDLTREE